MWSDIAALSGVSEKRPRRIAAEDCARVESRTRIAFQLSKERRFGDPQLLSRPFLVAVVVVQG